MINRIRLIRSVGQFDAVNSAATIDLRKLTVVYAENARGKTTLASILRSLSTGEPIPIIERKRLGAANAPEAIIDCTGDTSPTRFQNGAWSRTLSDVLVFDDFFVDRNVYSGMDVDAEHRQNLHDLILGETGVALARRVDQLAGQIREHNTELRNKTNAIPAADRHGLSVDDFCGLAERQDIDEAIGAAEQRLAALQNAGAVRTTSQFSALALPVVDFGSLATLLAQTVADLDAQAVEAVSAHFALLGDGAEEWIATGMRLGNQGAQLTRANECPFCRLALEGSPIFAQYRAYFGQTYTQLQRDLASAQSALESALSGDALAGFERQVRTAEQRQTFWARFTAVPGVGIDTTQVASAWQQVRDSVVHAIQAKRTDPLGAATLSADAQATIQGYQETIATVSASSAALLAANEAIQRVKESIQTGNTATAQAEVNRLRATKARRTPDNVQRCDDYLAVKQAKETADIEKAQAQRQLDAHRATAVPNWETAVNTYLSRLGAGFTVTRIQSQPTGGRPSCVYRLVINGHAVDVGPGVPAAGSPTFKNTLSSGDRNTLALAFFLASLDRDPNRANRVVVLDDPMSSLDKHRRMNTIQEVRTLLPTVAQVIVMSHDEYFLFDIYDRVAPRRAGTITDTTTLHVRRAATGSTIEEWDIESEKMCRHDKRHALLTQFANGGGGDPMTVAQSIRLHLEHVLRALYPDKFRLGETLREFRNRARSASQNGNGFMTEAKLTEVGQIVDYSNDFHHDTNPAADTVVINDTQLRDYVIRTLRFVSL